MITSGREIDKVFKVKKYITLVLVRSMIYLNRRGYIPITDSYVVQFSGVINIEILNEIKRSLSEFVY